MFVGEAPGRFGADDSELPFHGDVSGHNFERLLNHVSISRYEIFITNAVLCNPKDEKGRNSTPTSEEVTNCSAFLKEQIDIIQPKIVITLGSTALKACNAIERHALALATHVRSSSSWYGRHLIPLYHPGQRAMIHRSFPNQLADYQFVAEQFRRGRRSRRQSKSATASDTLAVVDALTSRTGQISYFSLHKLLFLAEVRHLETQGERLTRSYVVRQKDGPYFVDLHLSKLKAAGYSVRASGSRLMLTRQLDIHGSQTQLPSSITATLDMVVEKYGTKSDREIKQAAYLTRVMRDVLRREKQRRENLFNAPLFTESASD